jgi:hypothetical protein
LLDIKGQYAEAFQIIKNANELKIDALAKKEGIDAWRRKHVDVQLVTHKVTFSLFYLESNVWPMFESKCSCCCCCCCCFQTVMSLFQSSHMDQLKRSIGALNPRSSPACGLFSAEDNEQVELPTFVMVVGLPRSGTSLVETMLGMHPMVHLRHTGVLCGCVNACVYGVHEFNHFSIVGAYRWRNEFAWKYREGAVC